MVAVERGNADTLLLIIADKILPGTTVMSDIRSVYGGIERLPLKYHHQTVNHSKHYVDPDTVACTSGVESMWQKFKMKHKSRFGADRGLTSVAGCLAADGSYLRSVVPKNMDDQKSNLAVNQKVDDDKYYFLTWNVILIGGIMSVSLIGFIVMASLRFRIPLSSSTYNGDEMFISIQLDPHKDSYIFSDDPETTEMTTTADYEKMSPDDQKSNESTTNPFTLTPAKEPAASTEAAVQFKSSNPTTTKLMHSTSTPPSITLMHVLTTAAAIKWPPKTTVTIKPTPITQASTSTTRNIIQSSIRTSQTTTERKTSIFQRGTTKSIVTPTPMTIVSNVPVLQSQNVTQLTPNQLPNTVSNVPVPQSQNVTQLTPNQLPNTVSNVPVPQSQNMTQSTSNQLPNQLGGVNSLNETTNGGIANMAN
ncbi:unnamed protein product [Anisakis simplex]|uniref:DDE_Tnp_IS1595 domain-containing protein n=1 Tax=Anisakis simplex TaxID=6269 RepID=A0A0M3JZ75_ANISI|nr:unnamed protein product [Anisakis simplex]